MKNMNEKAPLFSIITVCYNSEGTIEKTLQSVLEQSIQDYEYIIVDGKSTDNTLSVIEKYRNKFNGRLFVISEVDEGIYDAMNKGIKLSKGVLVGIVNSDDYYEEDAFEEIKKEYEKKPNDHLVIYGMQRTLNFGKEVNTVIYAHENISNQMITHPTCFITKKTYEDFGLYNIKYKSSADYDYLLRLYHETPTEFRRMYKIISNYELGGMSSSQIGYRETAKLRLKYGAINWRKYFKLMMKSYLYQMIKGK